MDRNSGSLGNGIQIVICPGVHDSQLTLDFLKGVGQLDRALIFPAHSAPSYSSWHVLQFLDDCLGTDLFGQPIVFIAFSAGVVGAIGAAQIWQHQGGCVKALFAWDGWGVPLWANFPIHRISHDYFTHWSSAVLGAGTDGFYADPAVQHLDLWRSPQTAIGWWTSADPTQPAQRTTAANFLLTLLDRYQSSTGILK